MNLKTIIGVFHVETTVLHFADTHFGCCRTSSDATYVAEVKSELAGP